jgi:hypothetical protein
MKPGNSSSDTMPATTRPVRSTMRAITRKTRPNRPARSARAERLKVTLPWICAPGSILAAPTSVHHPRGRDSARVRGARRAPEDDVARDRPRDRRAIRGRASQEGRAEGAGDPRRCAGGARARRRRARVHRIRRGNLSGDEGEGTASSRSKKTGRGSPRRAPSGPRHRRTSTAGVDARDPRPLARNAGNGSDRRGR